MNSKNQIHRVFHEVSGGKVCELIGQRLLLLTADGVGFHVKVHTVYARDDHHSLLLGFVSGRDMCGQEIGENLIHCAAIICTDPLPYGVGQLARIGAASVRPGTSDDEWFDRDELSPLYRFFAEWEKDTKRPARERLLRIGTASADELPRVTLVS